MSRRLRNKNKMKSPTKTTQILRDGYPKKGRSNPIVPILADVPEGTRSNPMKQHENITVQFYR